MARHRNIETLPYELAYKLVHQDLMYKHHAYREKGQKVVSLFLAFLNLVMVVLVEAPLIFLNALFSIMVNGLLHLVTLGQHRLQVNTWQDYHIDYMDELSTYKNGMSWLNNTNLVIYDEAPNIQNNKKNNKQNPLFPSYSLTPVLPEFFEIIKERFSSPLSNHKPILDALHRVMFALLFLPLLALTVALTLFQLIIPYILLIKSLLTAVLPRLIFNTPLYIIDGIMGIKNLMASSKEKKSEPKRKQQEELANDESEDEGDDEEEIEETINQPSPFSTPRISISIEPAAAVVPAASASSWN